MNRLQRLRNRSGVNGELDDDERCYVRSSN